MSQDPNSVDITTSNGQVYLDSNKVVLRGYLRADLSQFYDHPFDGSLLAEDTSYEVTLVPVQSDYETWCEHIVHFDPNEYLGGFIKGVLADCSIVDQEVMVEGNPYRNRSPPLTSNRCWMLDAGFWMLDKEMPCFI